jgi:hypothetical protein
MVAPPIVPPVVRVPAGTVPEIVPDAVVWVQAPRASVQVLDLQMSVGSSSAECLRRKGATVGSRPRSCGTRQLPPA